MPSLMPSLVPTVGLLLLSLLLLLLLLLLLREEEDEMEDDDEGKEKKASMLRSELSMPSCRSMSAMSARVTVPVLERSRMEKASRMGRRWVGGRRERGSVGRGVVVVVVLLLLLLFTTLLRLLLCLLG